MNSWLEWKLALRNLKRNPRRTVSTGLAIVVAFVGLILLAGHILNIESAAKIPLIYGNGAGHISIYKKDGLDQFDLYPAKYYLSETEIDSIFQILSTVQDKIEKVGTTLSAQALLSVGNRSLPILIKGTQPEVDDFARNHSRLKKHAPEFMALQSQASLLKETKKVRDAISISRGISELIGFKGSIENLAEPEKQVVLAGRTFEGDLNATNATVAMLHSTGTPFLEDTSVNASLELVQELLQTKGVSHATVFLKNDPDMLELVQYLRSEFKRSNLEVEAHPFTDDRIGLFYNGTMSFLFSMGSFFMSLILGASGLIILNSMTIAVLERTQEMGTMRALGFPPARVKSLFVKEACWLALIASVVSIVVSEVLAQLISSAGWTIESAGTTYSVLIKIVTTPWFYFVVTTLMILLSAICSSWLVQRKSKVQISLLLQKSGAVT